MKMCFSRYQGTKALKKIINYLLCALWHFLSGLGYTSKNGRIPGYHMAKSIVCYSIRCKVP